MRTVRERVTMASLGAASSIALPTAMHLPALPLSGADCPRSCGLFLIALKASVAAVIGRCDRRYVATIRRMATRLQANN